MRDFHRPGRSPVFALNAMASTSHPAATEVAVAVMRAGGSAADAAVAAALTLSVVEPHMVGIGGDMFAIVGTPDGRLHGLNASGRSAAGVTGEKLRALGLTTIDENSIHGVTVPGALAGYQALLDRFGRFDLARALQPAIGHAEGGFAVAPRVAHDWARAEARIAGDPGIARFYLKDGRAPKVGEVMRQEALAATFRKIAAGGWRAFYEGEIAADIAATVAARGGFLTEADLAAVAVDWVEPIRAAYRGVEVAEIPPNGQGIAALILLRLLDRLGAAGLDPFGPERAHLGIEAARLAYGCRDAFVADPAAMRVTPAELLSDAFVERLAARFDPKRRMASVTMPEVPKASTIYLTVVDRDGLSVSFISSLYHHFGVGVATEKTGVLLQNRGACFTLEPGHANEAGPSKRPMHTIIPGFVSAGGRPVMPFGVMGGAYQAMGHAQFVSNWHDHGMDVQEALDAPRLFWTGSPDLVEVERGVSPAVVEGLKARGHRVAEVDEPFGGGQAILIDHARGVLVAGSDPRKDGAAMGW